MYYDNSRITDYRLFLTKSGAAKNDIIPGSVNWKDEKGE